ncbi:MAG TPA: phosphate acyltransferase PlsX, partial [Thermoleophilia bacterium]
MSARSLPYTSPHEVTAAWVNAGDTRVVRVAVDAAGGDNAPDDVIEGALRAAGPNLHVVLVGHEDRVRPLLPAAAPYVSVAHAPDAISYDEEPAKAARNKTGSSIVVGLKLVHEGGADAFVSAGNTGAVVAGSLLYVRRIKGVQRPAICTIMPCMPSPIAFLDAGANAECRPEHLRQFAVMGQAFAKEVMGIAEPNVGLLSIGEEPSKGTPDVIEAHRLIAADERIRFFGNIEGRDIMNRVVDVVVTDGFTGNVALKTIEGSAKAILGAIRATIDLSVPTKIGGMLLRRDLYRLRAALDPEEYGGAFLVGMNAPVIIAHGNSRATGVANAVRQARRGVVSDLQRTISRELGA